jgi:hypothetical protein
MTVWPPLLATKSLTLDGGATRRWLPPMKCEGRLYLAALLLGVPFFWTPFAGTPMARTVDGTFVLDYEEAR